MQIKHSEGNSAIELEKSNFYTTLSVTVNGKTHSLGYDLTPNGIGTTPLTEEKYRECLECLIPAMLKVLRDCNKLIKTS